MSEYKRIRMLLAENADGYRLRCGETPLDVILLEQRDFARRAALAALDLSDEKSVEDPFLALNALASLEAESSEGPKS